MPYVEGETLRHRLDRERQLPVADAIRIACEVANALEYAHHRGVVHRDVKPENILLDDDQALVTDFGIALAVEQAGVADMPEVIVGWIRDEGTASQPRHIAGLILYVD